MRKDKRKKNMKGTRKLMAQETRSITLALRELSRQGLEVDMIALKIHPGLNPIKSSLGCFSFLGSSSCYAWWWFCITGGRQIRTNYNLHNLFLTEGFSVCFEAFGESLLQRVCCCLGLGHSFRGFVFNE